MLPGVMSHPESWAYMQTPAFDEPNIRQSGFGFVYPGPPAGPVAAQNRPRIPPILRQGMRSGPGPSVGSIWLIIFGLTCPSFRMVDAARSPLGSMKRVGLFPAYL